MVPPDAIEQPASAAPGSPAGSDLCRDCGLCCDGSLFDNVALSGDEVEAAAANGLQPLAGEHGARFLLPCPRFCGICTIYPARPRRCREYRCQLLARLERGEVDFAAARAVVVEAQRLAGAADALALSGENRAASRRRWGQAFGAMTGDRAGACASPPAEPRWLVAMTAFNVYLDRHFRKPHRRRVSIASQSDMMSDEV